MQLLYQYKKVIKLLFFILPFAAIAETEYEPNNTIEDAHPIFVNDFSQAHKFDYAGDEDWLVFYAEKGVPYDIQIESDGIGQAINPGLELYNENKEPEVKLFDINFAGEGELLSWQAPASGFFYIRVVNIESEFNTDAHYKIKVYLPLAPNNGLVKGKVVDQCTQSGIKAELITRASQGLSHRKGQFGLVLNPGVYTVTARARKYKEKSETVEVKEVKSAVIQFDLLPEEGCSVTPSSDPSPIQSEVEQLKQKTVAIYDESSRILTIKDVRVGDDILAVSLQAEEDLSFILTMVKHLTKGVSSTPAFYNYDSLLADLPEVFAFDQLFKVKLRRLSAEGAFVIEKAEPLK